jgi:hypothetical protein
MSYDDPDLNIMESWTLKRYAPLVDGTPYEDGYVNLGETWYDPADILSRQFGRGFPQDKVRELAEDLTAISPEWVAIPHGRG